METAVPSSTTTSLDDDNTTVSTIMTSPAPNCIICDYDLSLGMKSLRVALGLAIILANIITVVAVVRAPTLQVSVKG
jgi:hypothetical protein